MHDELRVHVARRSASGLVHGLERLGVGTGGPGSPPSVPGQVVEGVAVDDGLWATHGDRGGIFGNQKVRTYKVTVKLENYRDEPVRVRVLDRVPIEAASIVRKLIIHSVEQLCLRGKALPPSGRRSG